MANSLEGNYDDLPPMMVKQLAELAFHRYHSATRIEGLTEQAAFEEIVRIILGTYREALAS